MSYFTGHNTQRQVNPTHQSGNQYLLLLLLKSNNSKSKLLPAKYVLNESDYAKVEELASEGCSTQIIADQLGLDRATLYDHLKRSTELSRRYKKGKADIAAEICGKLIENCKNGD